MARQKILEYANHPTSLNCLLTVLQSLLAIRAGSSQFSILPLLLILIHEPEPIHSFRLLNMEQRRLAQANTFERFLSLTDVLAASLDPLYTQQVVAHHTVDPFNADSPSLPLFRRAFIRSSCAKICIYNVFFVGAITQPGYIYFNLGLPRHLPRYS